MLCVGAGGLGSPAAPSPPRQASGLSASSTSTPSTRAIFNDRFCMARQTSAARSWSPLRDRLTAINPEVHVETYETRLTSANALELFRDYDVILDGTDNFATRYLVNDACVLLKKANAYGSIFRFEDRRPCSRR